MYYFLLDKLQRLLLVLISGKARKTFGDCWPNPLFLSRIPSPGTFRKEVAVQDLLSFLLLFNSANT